MLKKNEILNKGELLPQKFKFPLYIMWDITYLCNLKCIHCYNNSRFKGNDFLLDINIMKKIAYQIIQGMPISVSFGGGEPLLFPKELFIIGKELQHKVWLNLITNGTLIDENLADRISETFSAVQISINGGYSNTHDYLSGVKGSFDRTIEGITHLKKAGYEKLEVAFVLNKININEFKDFVKLMGNLENVKKIRVQNFIPSGRGYFCANELAVSNEKIQEFVEDIKMSNSSIPIIYDDVIDEVINFREKTIPNQFMHIRPNGDVGVFTHIPIIIGNIHENSLQEIWDKSGITFFNDPKIKSILDSKNESKDLAYFKAINNYPWLEPPVQLKHLEKH